MRSDAIFEADAGFCNRYTTRDVLRRCSRRVSDVVDVSRCTKHAGMYVAQADSGTELSEAAGAST